MATVSTDNYTLGQVDLYFSSTIDDADLITATFRSASNNLGNIVTSEIMPDVTYLEHFISDNGLRKKDKVAVSIVNLTIPFTFDEMNSNNLRRFFMASDLGSNQLGVFEVPLDEGSAQLRFRTSVGQDMAYYIPKCTIRPDGGLAVNPEDWWTAPMVLEVLYYEDAVSDPFENAPYGYVDTTATP